MGALEEMAMAAMRSKALAHVAVMIAGVLAATLGNLLAQLRGDRAGLRVP
jgi:hypothetical protein